MARKQQINSVSEKVKMAQAETQELLAPAHIELTDDDKPFWNNILAEKPKIEWTEHDLELAALLARSMSKLVQEQNQLEDEGSVLYSDKGNAYGNPRARMVSDLSSRVMKYRQSLGLHNRGKVGEPRDVKRQRDAAKPFQDMADPDPLFARPTFQ